MQVFGATGGNPLFVTELHRRADGPAAGERAATSSSARMRRAAPCCLEALCLLAVVPARARAVDRTRAATRRRVDAASTPSTPACSTGDATYVWFRHELVRRAIEETLTPSQDVQAHLAVARLLDDRNGEPARIVHHAALADDAELVLKAGPMAAARRSGPALTVRPRSTSRPRCAMPTSSRPSEQAELLTRRANSLYLVNQFEESMTCAEQAVTIARPLGDDELLARALLALGRTVAVGPSARTRRSAVEQRALDVLGPDGDPELRAIAHADTRGPSASS